MMYRTPFNSRKIARGGKRRRGAEILEAALVLPIVLSLIFGMVEFAYYFHVQHTVQAAAREAARTACVSGTEGTNANATTRCNNILTSSGLNPSNLTLTISPDAFTADPGDDITVDLRTTWNLVGIRLFGFVADTRVIKSTVVFRKEG